MWGSLMVIGQKQCASCSRSCQQLAHWSRLAHQGCHRHSLSTEYVDDGASALWCLLRGGKCTGCWLLPKEELRFYELLPMFATR